MVGGGEEKAQPLIEKLMKMDARKGITPPHLQSSEKKIMRGGCGICEGAGRQAEDGHRIYDIGDYFVQRKNAEKTSGGGRGRRRLGAARPWEISTGRSVDSARREAAEGNNC